MRLLLALGMLCVLAIPASAQSLSGGFVHSQASVAPPSWADDGRAAGFWFTNTSEPFHESFGQKGSFRINVVTGFLWDDDHPLLWFAPNFDFGISDFRINLSFGGAVTFDDRTKPEWELGSRLVFAIGARLILAKHVVLGWQHFSHARLGGRINYGKDSLMIGFCLEG